MVHKLLSKHHNKLSEKELAQLLRERGRGRRQQGRGREGGREGEGGREVRMCVDLFFEETIPSPT